MWGRFIQLFLWLKKQKSVFKRKMAKKNLANNNYVSRILERDVDDAYVQLTQQCPFVQLKFKKNKKERKIDLSIIIPVYNAEKTIKQCINSIVRQNVAGQYEVICIDDGSLDSSLKILNDFSRKYPQIKVISQVNSGAAVARNKGLDESRGRYIFFMDADDFLTENALKVLLEKAEETDADITLGIIGKYITRYGIESYPRRKKDIECTDIIEASEMVSGAPWGKLYKAHLWETVRFLEGYAFEDTIIFLNIYPQCKIFYNIQDPVYCFRSSSTSLFKQQTVLHGIDSLWVVINCVELAKENGINILDDGYYQLVMWHLSAIMRSRLKVINSEEIIENAFLVAAQFICKEFVGKKKYIFRGDNADVYQLLEESFINKDFGLWQQCSKAV